MELSTSLSSLSERLFHGLIAICVMASLACWVVESQFAANLTIGGSTFEMHLNSSAFIEELDIKRSEFPNDFIFGVATSAAQTEGSAKEGGRGPSIWDNRAEKFPDKIIDSDKFSTAIDSYKRYKEDIKLIKEVGVNSYRFSISWSRILPKGSLSGGINQEGIDHYNSLIDELIKNDIKPFVTLLHFDLPQALEDKYGGYLNRSFVDDFKDYSEVCFKSFGDRVKNWFTLNEPTVPASLGYEFGIAPPARCSLPEGLCALSAPPPGKCFRFVSPCPLGNSSTEPYIVAHHLILAHATAVKLYRENFQVEQRGEIGVALVTKYLVPYSESEEDKAATERLFDFRLGWFLEPFVFGDYPNSMKDLVKERLPTFSEQEKIMIKGSLDFVGINYYSSSYAKNRPTPSDEMLRYSVDPSAEIVDSKDGVSLGLYYGHWPEGLQKLMGYIKEKYQNPKVYISENGARELRNDNLPLDEQLDDPYRISYIVRHLYRLHEAIKDGVNVKGYFYWSLFDDFEWGMGFTDRFGIYYIDFNDNYKRIPKLSSTWFRSFLQDNHTSPNYLLSAAIGF